MLMLYELDGAYQKWGLILHSSVENMLARWWDSQDGLTDDSCEICEDRWSNIQDFKVVVICLTSPVKILFLVISNWVVL